MHDRHSQKCEEEKKYGTGEDAVGFKTLQSQSSAAPKHCTVHRPRVSHVRERPSRRNVATKSGKRRRDILCTGERRSRRGALSRESRRVLWQQIYQLKISWTIKSPSRCVLGHPTRLLPSRVPKRVGRRIARRAHWRGLQGKSVKDMTACTINCDTTIPSSTVNQHGCNLCMDHTMHATASRMQIKSTPFKNGAS